MRSLARSPSYLVVALLTLGLGIGANTAVFSVVRGVLLRPLPYPEPDRLVRVWELTETGGRMNVAWRNFLDWQEASSYASLVAYSGGTSTVLGAGEARRVGTAAVSRGFFETLGVRPVLGRLPRPDEHAEGAEPVAVVSEGFWRTHLGSDPDLHDCRLEVDGFDLRIVGVVPWTVERPNDTDLWYPLELRPQPESRTAHNWSVVGRLAEGVSVARADEELDAITDSFLERSPEEAVGDPTFFPRSVRTEPLLDALVSDSRRALWVLLGAAGLLLLVACTNLASMELARGAGREREVAVRRALGAGQGRVARRLFVESALVALAGGALGVVVATELVAQLPRFAPASLPRVHDVRVDGSVLMFALATAVATALLFGLAPALRNAGTSLEGVLRNAGSRGSSSAGRERLWSGLVVAEVALALLLLVGAGLLIRSVGEILSTDPGFRTTGVLLATVAPPPGTYPSAGDRGAYYARLLEEVRGVRGVERVGLVSSAPLRWAANGLVQVRGGSGPDALGTYQVADPEYFRALEIPLLEGRLFEATDRAESEHVVVVSESFARQAWPEGDAIGKQMTSGGMDDFWNQEKWATVVGVVADIRQGSLTDGVTPMYYFPLSQRPYRTWAATLVVRPGSGDGAALFAPLRDAIHRVDRDVPADIETMESRVAGSIGERRFVMLVLGLFALVGLVLAVAGVFGVVSYSVARRTREMGIRIALGAPPAAVQGLVQRRSLMLTAAGLAIGIAGALAFSRVLSSLLHEVSATDPLTFVAVALVMACAALVAAWLPARRATRIDPLLTIQAE